MHKLVKVNKPELLQSENPHSLLYAKKVERTGRKKHELYNMGMTLTNARTA